MYVYRANNYDKLLCIYHSADADGHCSGAIVKKKHPDAELYGWDYGHPVPWYLITPESCVILVDLIFEPFSLMERLVWSCKDLLIIDHHKSNIDVMTETWRRDWPPNADAHCKVGIAACELCWEYFFPEHKLPRAVYLIGRYDVWDWKNTIDSIEFRYGLGLYDTWPNTQDTQLWDRLLVDPETGDQSFTNKIIEEGKIIVKYRGQQNKNYIKATGFEIEWNDYRCLMSNSLMNNSKLFDSRYDPEQHDLMIMFGWKRDHWKIVIATDKPEIDVGAICKEFDGGGHKAIGGFQSKELPFYLPTR